ncbi:MAG: protein phosphatase 2C domain-containing protein [Planctomycetota bacterium]
MDVGDRANLTVNSLSDVGRRRLANEDAYVNDDRLGLYAVCDGIGGQPSGEAASQTVAYALPHVFRRRLRDAGHADSASVAKALGLALVEISAGMHRASADIDVLTGMGATAVGLLIDRGRGFVFNAGDSRVYRHRDGRLERLTRDHVRSYRRVREGQLDSTAEAEHTQRRLLHQFCGMFGVMSPDVFPLEPVPGDRYLICTDGVCDPVDDDAIAALLSREADGAAAVRSLIEAANANGGPDNITATIVDYLAASGGPEPGETPPRAAPIKGVAATMDHTLRALDDDLDWLLTGSREIASLSLVSAVATVKRRLGTEAYQRFLKLHPSNNPAHVFHQACAQPEAKWRRGYQAHLDAMAEPLANLDGCRLSHVLAARETATIFRSLWNDWRHVEQRYFAITQRAALGKEERSLDTLIDHMLKSVRTLRGLLRFYPRFLRPEPPQDPSVRRSPDDTGVVNAYSSA